MHLSNLGGRTSRLPLLFVLAALVSGLIGAPAASAANPTSPPNRGIFGPTGQPPRVSVTPRVAQAGFQDVTLPLPSLTEPTKVAWDPDGRMYVAEKAGKVRVFNGTTEIKNGSNSWASFTTAVHNYWDRGFLGMTVGSGYVYVLYTYNHRLQDTGVAPPYWPNDSCPGSTDTGCVASARLSRFQINANGSAGPEVPLIEDWCQQFPSHSIGDVRFGPDGNLYVSAGEAASFTGIDYGQLGGNPCGDPTNEGGSLRAQSPRRPAAEPRSLDGSLLRLNPATFDGAADNPSFTSANLSMRRIIAYGLRNPFRFAFKGSEVWVGDVGEDVTEEIDRVPLAPATQKNYGWPCFEGTDRHGNFDSQNLPRCESLYPPAGAEAGTTVDPFYTYTHLPSDPTDLRPFPGRDTACGTGNGSVISGLAFASNVAYPAAYDGALFFADHSRLCIWAMQPTTSGGTPDPSKIVTIETNAAGPVDLEIGPNGNVFYVDFDGGTIHELRYSTNTPPTAVAKANVTSGAAPLAVTFDGTASTDPGGAIAGYDWNFGDGSAHSTAPKPTHTFAAGTFTVTLTVTDNQGATGTASLTINSSNHAPVPSIATPVGTLHWSVGQSISFSGGATDTEDGAEPASRLSWALVMLHCTAPDRVSCHTHNISTFAGVSSGSFIAPDHVWPSYLQLNLTATDSNGASATVTRILDPNAVDLSFTSIPSGATLSVGNFTGSAPFTRTVIVGSANTVIAPDQILGGHASSFTSWSDGGPQTHVITAPASPQTYQAVFNPAEAADTCATATAAPAEAWLSEKIDTPGDVDWFSFAVPRTGYALAILGGLDADLRLDLYSSSCGTLLASSQHAGNVYEGVYKRLSAGTYRVKVSGIGGAVSSSPYFLRFRNLAERVQLESRTSWSAAGRIAIVGVVLNNTSSYKRAVTVRADLFDAANRRIGSLSTPVYATVMNPRTRASFRLTFTPPAGYHHYALVTTSLTTSSHAVAFVVTPGARSVDGSGALHVTGTIRNPNRYSVRAVTVAVTLFDNMRNVVNVIRVVPATTTLRAGASTTFAVVFGDHTTYQVIDYRANGVR